jgi:hypothetical protein
LLKGGAQTIRRKWVDEQWYLSVVNITAALYERLALSRDKKGVKQLAEKGQIITRVQAWYQPLSFGPNLDGQDSQDENADGNDPVHPVHPCLILLPPFRDSTSKENGPCPLRSGHGTSFKQLKIKALTTKRNM